MDDSSDDIPASDVRINSNGITNPFLSTLQTKEPLIWKR